MYEKKWLIDIMLIELSTTVQSPNSQLNLHIR